MLSYYEEMGWKQKADEQTGTWTDFVVESRNGGASTRRTRVLRWSRPDSEFSHSRELQVRPDLSALG